jgi:hypothetical protein
VHFTNIDRNYDEITETSYLETDDLYGYGYLELVKKVFGASIPNMT